MTQLLELFLSYEECKEAVNNIKKEKSLGLDGLPSVFSTKQLKSLFIKAVYK